MSIQTEQDMDREAKELADLIVQNKLQQANQRWLTTIKDLTPWEAAAIKYKVRCECIKMGMKP